MSIHRYFRGKSESADHAAVQADYGNLSGNELTRNLPENNQLQSSQLAEPLWSDPDIKSGISMCELIPTAKKKKKKAHAGNEWSNILPRSSQAKKKPLPLLKRKVRLSRTNLVLRANQLTILFLYRNSSHTVREKNGTTLFIIASPLLH